MSDKLPLPPEATFAGCPKCGQLMRLDHLAWVKAKDAEIAALRAEVQMLTRDRDLAREAREENVKSLRAEIADRQAAESLVRELAAVARAAEAIREERQSCIAEDCDSAGCLGQLFAEAERALSALSEAARGEIGAKEEA